jgi:hypothetical protein
MARTEDDLHAHYADPPVDPTAVARLTEHATALTTGTHHHRRWVPAAAALAVVILIGGGAAVLQAQKDPTPESAATTPPVPSTTTTTSPAPAPTEPTVGQLTLQRFLDLAPRPGTLTNLVDLSLVNFGTVQLVYDDGHGPAQIDVSVTTTGTGTDLPCGAVGGFTCSTLPDGTLMRVHQGPEYPNGHTPNAARWSIDILSPGKVGVYLDEWNAPTEKGTDPTRADPPFTIAELTTIATSPTWTTPTTPDLATRAATLPLPRSTR